MVNTHRHRITGVCNYNQATTPAVPVNSESTLPHCYRRNFGLPKISSLFVEILFTSAHLFVCVCCVCSVNEADSILKHLHSAVVNVIHGKQAASNGYKRSLGGGRQCGFNCKTRGKTCQPNHNNNHNIGIHHTTMISQKNLLAKICSESERERL